MVLSLIKLFHDPAMAVRTIDHKFMVSGHSFLPNDADFGTIEENSRKKQFIFSQQEWFDLARESKCKPPAFEIIEMKRHGFLLTKSLEDSVVNRKKPLRELTYLV